MPSISTGVAETNNVIIKKLTSEPAAIAGSQWWSMKRSEEGTQLDVYGEGDIGYLAQLFFQLISKLSTGTTPGTSSEPVTVQDSNDDSKSEAVDSRDLTIVQSKSDLKAENNTKQDDWILTLSDIEKSEIDEHGEY